jgi:NAD(P)-dependent dehydrogenase (short-subunit alcohol dehydrogenase family)
MPVSYLLPHWVFTLLHLVASSSRTFGLSKIWGFLVVGIAMARANFANILYGLELARRYPRISVALVHPGVIKTGLVNSLGCAGRMLVAVTSIGKTPTPEQGVQNQLWAATVDKKALKSGAFYEPVGELGNQANIRRANSWLLSFGSGRKSNWKVTNFEIDPVWRTW